MILTLTMSKGSHHTDAQGERETTGKEPHSFPPWRKSPSLPPMFKLEQPQEGEDEYSDSDWRRVGEIKRHVATLRENFTNTVYKLSLIHI